MNEKKRGMSSQQLTEAVVEVQLKRLLGEKLSKRDELLLAYGHYRPACHHKHR